MNLRKLQEVDVKNKRVIVRVDLNLPVKDGIILDHTRIEKLVPTIQYLIENQAKIILMSHFGRPKAYDEKYSLKIFAPILAQFFKNIIKFSSQTIGDESLKLIQEMRFGEIILLENLRFNAGETSNDVNFAKELSNLADIYVNDSFSSSHRAHASVCEITKYMPSYAGLLLQSELVNIEKILNKPLKPFAAIVGGSKISTKLSLLNNLLPKVDYLVIGGAMANSFLKALGQNIGASFYEEDLLKEALEILANAKNSNTHIILPSDAIVAKNLNAEPITKDIQSIDADEHIYDIGPKTCQIIIKMLENVKTIIWNGPLGVFENPNFAKSSNLLAKTLAQYTKSNNAITIAGGGDVVAAINKAGFAEDFTYISTAGGAFLEWLEGKTLPGIEVLLKNEDNSCK